MLIKPAPSFMGMKTASVDGHHFADLREGMECLAEAKKQARAAGYETLVGPMANGSWGDYRLVLYSDGSPIFFGEPQSGVYDLEAYLKSGFTIGEMHSSAKADLIDNAEPRNKISGLTVRSWDGSDAENFLLDIHAVTMKAFAKTPLFTPISAEQFIAAYKPLLQRTDPRLMLSAYDANGILVAFLLSYPDPRWPDSLIVKTYASTVPGAGRYLLELIHWKGCHEFGYKQVVHGLMRDGNYSRSGSKRTDSTIFRRYALMEKHL